jgi:hypothetical protein
MGAGDVFQPLLLFVQRQIANLTALVMQILLIAQFMEAREES